MDTKNNQMVMILALLVGIAALVVAVLAYRRTSDLPDGSVTTEEIADLAITNAKLANNSVDQDKIIDSYFLNDDYRYFFEFWLKPVTTIGALGNGGSTTTLALKMDTDSSATFYGNSDNLGMQVNLNFYLAGTNAIAFSSATTNPSTSTVLSGLNLTTATGTDDLAVVSSINPWASSNSQFDFTSTVVIPTAIIKKYVYIGFKAVQGDIVLVTNADIKAGFFYSSATTSSTFFSGKTLLDATKLHFIYSIGNEEFISQLPITVAVSTEYKLRIKCNASRQLAIYVNDIQYNIHNGSETITAVTTGTTLSTALANDIVFYAVTGSANLDNAAATFNNKYMKCINIA